MPGRYADDDGHSEALTEILETEWAHDRLMAGMTLGRAEREEPAAGDGDEPADEEGRDSPEADLEIPEESDLEVDGGQMRRFA